MKTIRKRREEKDQKAAAKQAANRAEYLKNKEEQTMPREVFDSIPFVETPVKEEVGTVTVKERLELMNGIRKNRTTANKSMDISDVPVQKTPTKKVEITEGGDNNE